MNDCQVAQIRKNLTKLLGWTNCNVQLLALLQADDVLGDDDIQAINCEKQPNRQAVILYDILKTRTNAYYSLVKAFIETRQTGAAKLLLEVTTENISQLNVSFLGKENLNSLKCLLNPDQIKSIHTWLQENLSMQDWLEIHENIFNQNNPLQLLRDTIPPPYPLYISRLLSRRIVVVPNLFEEKCPDVFVFKDTDRMQLRKFVSSFEIQSSTVHLLTPKSTARFILLVVESDWKDIRKKVTSPVHMIRYEHPTETFLLESTSGVSDILRRHFKKSGQDESSDASDANASDSESEKEDIYQSDFEDLDTSDSDVSELECENEDTILSELEDCSLLEEEQDISDISEKKFLETILAEDVQGVCICDSPGMGKSLLLANLANIIRDTCPDSIVAYFQLRNFSIPENQTCPQEALLEQLATSKFLQRILSELIKSKNTKLELFFDGLDEVQDDSLESTTEFLKNVIESLPNARVFVTSRPVVRIELEKALGVIAYDIKPFNTKTQLKFLTTHWMITDPDSDLLKLNEFANNCLKSTRSVLKDGERNITGIPLQCKLLADVYENEAILYANKNRNISIELSFSFGISLSEIYSKFILRQLGESKCNFDCMHKVNIFDAKCDIYCQVKSFHVWQALQLIFPKLAYKLLSHVANFDNLSKQQILLPGILRETDHDKESNFDFIHRTLAEYLVAEFVWTEILLNFNDNLKTIYYQQSIEQHAFNEIFAVKRPAILESWDDSCLFRESVVAYFLNSKITSRPQNAEVYCSAKTPSINYLYFMALQACTKQNYEGLLELLQKATENSMLDGEMKIACRWRMKNYDNEEYEEVTISEDREITSGIFASLVKNCSANTLRTVCQFFLKLTNVDLMESTKYSWGPIYTAIQRADYELVYYLAQQITLEDGRLLYKCFEYTSHKSSDFVDRRIEIAKLLLSKSPCLLTEAWETEDLIEDSNENLAENSTEDLAENSIEDLTRESTEISRPNSTSNSTEHSKHPQSPLQSTEIHLKCIKFLIENGCDFRLLDNSGNSILYSAACYMTDDDFFKLCSFLYFDCLAADYFMNPDNWVGYVSNFQISEKKRSAKSLYRILSFLEIDVLFVDNIKNLQQQGNYDKYKPVFHSLLYSAFGNNKPEFSDLILSQDSSILELECYPPVLYADIHTLTATQYASSCKKLSMLKFFVSRGASVFVTDSEGQTLLHRAAETRNCNFFHKVMQMLGTQRNIISENPGVGVLVCDGNTCYKTKPRDIQELFNWRKYGNLETPLHYAVRNLPNISSDTLDLLLACGRRFETESQDFTFVDINAVNLYEETALHLAVWNDRSIDVVKHLVTRGGDHTLKNNDGCDVTHFCACKGLKDLLQYFLEMGSDVNNLDKLGNNALQCGLDWYWDSNDRSKIIELLISAGADTDHKNVVGRTAYDIAVKRSRDAAILNILK